MNVIFYDIDGVFNTGRTAVAANQKRLYLDDGQMVPHLDTFAVSFMVQLAKVANAKLVCSSTWRKLFTLEEIAIAIPIMAGFESIQRDFIAAHAEGDEWRTGDHSYAHRHKDIDEYIKANKVENFVIFDDKESAGVGNEENFILVNAYDGLTFNDMHKAGEIMGNTKLTAGGFLF